MGASADVRVGGVGVRGGRVVEEAEDGARLAALGLVGGGEEVGGLDLDAVRPPLGKRKAEISRTSSPTPRRYRMRRQNLWHWSLKALTWASSSWMVFGRGCCALPSLNSPKLKALREASAHRTYRNSNRAREVFH